MTDHRDPVVAEALRDLDVPDHCAASGQPSTPASPATAARNGTSPTTAPTGTPTPT